LLVEGNSIRSTERLTGVHRDTMMRLAVTVGGKCKKFLNAWLRNLKLRHVQADEIWTFVGCKQETLKRALVVNPTMGDQFLYVAFDQDTKLIASYAIGKRCTEVTQAFMYDLADRIITDAPQLSTDGWQAYPNAVKNAFGDEIAYGQIIKEFAEPIQPGRYGPPVLVASERRQITGLTDIDLKSICTSHVERNNLTIRTFLRRFTRLSLGFSKKLENLAAAVALHVAHYNFCRVHGTTRITPAMAAGVTDHVWELDELLAAI
jgi:IS1 family transposase